MNDQKNLVFFVLIFIGVMVGWNYFYEAPKTQKAPAAQTQQSASAMPGIPAAPSVPVIEDRKEVIQASARVQIDTPSLRGSINLKGGSIDDLKLEKYRETIEKNSDNIVLLAPLRTEKPYFAQFGWTTADKNLAMPDENSVWTADRKEITQTSGPVKLSWVNPQGIQFERLISVDENYLFTVKQTVTNNTNQTIQLVPYGQVSRIGTPENIGNIWLHEGPIGYIDDSLKEYDYSKLKETIEIKNLSQGGWIGITDKYWLTAIIPDQKTKSEFYFKDNRLGQQDDYVTGYLGESISIAPAQITEVQLHLFAGAKVLNILDAYEEKLGVKHFDKAVDFGRLYFFTKPLFYFLEMIYGWVGNFGLAIMLLTVIFKLIFYPLANKSFRSMARMKELQPKMERIKERYADDKMRMNQEMMELFKKEGVNPASGCWPTLIQFPVFLCLYKVLFVSTEMRQAPFYGWIHDLSAQDPTSVFNLFGLIPWDPPTHMYFGYFTLIVGVLPILMGVSMWVQIKLNPSSSDPMAQTFGKMPFFLPFLIATLPAGLVLYWTWSNLLSIAQQWLIIKSSSKKAKAKA